MTEVLAPTKNGTAAVAGEAALRTEAMRRLKKKGEVRAHLLAYVLVNSFLWLIWGIVYAAAGGTRRGWPSRPYLSRVSVAEVIGRFGQSRLRRRRTSPHARR